MTLAKAVDRFGGSVVCWLLAFLRQVRNLVAPRTGLVEVRTLLLVKFWGLGNLVLLIPILRTLRARFPDARIVMVTLRRNRELLDACDDVNTRIYIDDRNVLVLGASLIASVFRTWRTHPDLCIDFEQFARFSAILAVLARSRQIVGLATPGQVRSVLYHKAIPYDDTQHMGSTYLDLARAAGVQARDYRTWPVPYRTADRDAALALLEGRGDRPVVVMHPGTGDNFQGRRWPAESFAALADRLVDAFDATIVVTGAPGERELVAEVVARIAHADHVVDAAGRLSILGLAALVDHADLLVSNDTAPVHLGSAAGTPVFAFFGPNTPRLYGPLSAGSHAFYTDLPCSPCLTNMNYKTSLCRMPVCVRDIAVEDVFVRIASHVEERRRAAGRRRAPSRADEPDAEEPDDEEPSSSEGRRVRAG